MAVEARKKMNVPITKPSLGEEEANAPYESIKSGWVTQGPKVAEFEKAIAAYVGAKHGIATTSCTTGLHLALATAGVGPGDRAARRIAEAARARPRTDGRAARATAR